MKKNILRISILPLIVILALSLSEPQQGKENKGNGNNNSEAKGNQDRGQQSKGNNNSSDPGKQKGESGRADNGQDKGKNSQDNRGNDNQDNRGNKNDKSNKNDDSRGNSGNNGNSDNDKGKGNDGKNVNAGKNGNGNGGNGNGSNGNGKSRKETIQWDRDENINWGFENYSSRKRPKDFKKVTVCHNTGDSNYPVTISVSENALKAHVNHGDQVGNCTVNYSDRWPDNFIRTRENVYNTYQNTWETMSYSEALVRFAADKLLGIKSTFQAQRPTLTAAEIQRRELLIMDLQNNVNSLENQLAVSRQRTAGLNININL